MANPANVIDMNSYQKWTRVDNIGTSQTNYLSCNSNYGMTVTNLTFHNYSSSSATVTVWLKTGDGNGKWIANGMTVPAKSSLNLINKETPVYLTNGSSSVAVEGLDYSASANNTFNAYISYEYWYDPT